MWLLPLETTFNHRPSLMPTELEVVTIWTFCMFDELKKKRKMELIFYIEVSNHFECVYLISYCKRVSNYIENNSWYFINQGILWLPTPKRALEMVTTYGNYIFPTDLLELCRILQQLILFQNTQVLCLRFASLCFFTFDFVSDFNVLAVWFLF